MLFSTDIRHMNREEEIRQRGISTSSRRVSGGRAVVRSLTFNAAERGSPSSTANFYGRSSR